MFIFSWHTIFVSSTSVYILYSVFEFLHVYFCRPGIIQPYVLLCQGWVTAVLVPEGELLLLHIASPILGLVIALRPLTPKHVRGGRSHYTDTSEPVDGNGHGAQIMVTVQSGFRTRDLSISGPTRLPPALTGPTASLSTMVCDGSASTCNGCAGQCVVMRFFPESWSVLGGPVIEFYPARWRAGTQRPGFVRVVHKSDRSLAGLILHHLFVLCKPNNIVLLNLPLVSSSFCYIIYIILQDVNM
jgi:hypothetical protein